MSDNIFNKIYLFRDMTNDQLSFLKEASTTTVYNAADEIFSQGDKATSLYVVNYGSIKVYQTTEGGENVNVATLGSGSHFGEMSFLDNEPRSASVEII
ncbi:MAG: cyclic nucleotide-binding domain-containing protein, partial [Bdellovibrionales bacterium]|nr:cyclic nucleotide-binding domain-containing protein [Bdellovibrionales bacterium]